MFDEYDNDQDYPGLGPNPPGPPGEYPGPPGPPGVFMPPPPRPLPPGIHPPYDGEYVLLYIFFLSAHMI